jgi:CarD family transcriptional regulator
VEFKVDDRVVYPNHGIGVIEGIEQTEMGGQSCDFYCLRIIANETRVRVPTYNADSVGLRKMISRRQLTSLFEQLREEPARTPRSWKGRYKENSDRMRTGSIFEVAEVLKNLSRLSRSKNLSYREKRMLDKARQLVVTEVAAVQKTAVEKAEQQIDRALAASTSTASRAH